MPIINCYQTIPVIFYPYQRDIQRYISQPNKVLENHPIQGVNDKYIVLNDYT